MKKILIVEELQNTTNRLVDQLKKTGYLVKKTSSCDELKLFIEQIEFDLVLISLSSLDQVQKSLHLIHSIDQMPVIVLSESWDKQSKISILKDGADDFISDPSDIELLLTRIEVALRRTQPIIFEKKETMIQHKDLIIYPENRSLYIQGKEIHLTNSEFDILSFLMSNPKKVFTKKEIFCYVWKVHSFVGTEGTINVHISHLRAKLLKANPQMTYIDTVWGVGFKMSEDEG
ncbi:response regulator transcription factor [Carnobacterium divergens]|uniref:DNA-binding response regulator n=1 Tax=Carnobacterium divergens TaxID=2748 RepID=A0A7Z8CYY2_CARDV|nr:response regulator transcription factor [Carnobacterium divergens]MPQ21254.1 response regulator transcription factor [Carnobacterium divergens]TFI71305.1 DNA-binding response regulator [Carnobacterium divergens]TFI75947.1 DNA-binding response regulator [Carnobacterium divergens]TFI81819.1 DNA-binding response regulator [Carnobacterium divergens]TFI94128.1 DNA-binding response regulator [Carnobacterium divergens]